MCEGLAGATDRSSRPGRPVSLSELPRESTDGGVHPDRPGPSDAEDARLSRRAVYRLGTHRRRVDAIGREQCRHHVTSTDDGPSYPPSAEFTPVARPFVRYLTDCVASNPRSRDRHHSRFDHHRSLADSPSPTSRSPPRPRTARHMHSQPIGPPVRVLVYPAVCESVPPYANRLPPYAHRTTLACKPVTPVRALIAPAHGRLAQTPSMNWHALERSGELRTWKSRIYRDKSTLPRHSHAIRDRSVEMKIDSTA